MTRLMMCGSKVWRLFLLGLAVTTVVLVHRGALADENSPGFRVIVHADNAARSVTRSDLSKLILKKSITWQDGTEAYPVDLDPSSPVRAAFSDLILGRSISNVVSYWQRQVFSGHAVPPPTVDSDEKVVAYVRSHVGGIGYVSPGARLEGVRELTVVDY